MKISREACTFPIIISNEEETEYVFNQHNISLQKYKNNDVLSKDNIKITHSKPSDIKWVNPHLSMPPNTSICSAKAKAIDPCISASTQTSQFFTPFQENNISVYLSQPAGKQYKSRLILGSKQTYLGSYTNASLD